ncbi:MAG TPA: radical SAM protein [Deltaproteobacteria bacterium]|nr:radical SAM protein [Deltaproteobacteria bacterium]
MERPSPAYLGTQAKGVFDQRADELQRLLAPCRLCPRQCKVNRIEGEQGYCRAPSEVVISGVSAHFGEEQPLVGTYGSGTIFFAGCGLRCVFCQNHDISMRLDGVAVSREGLAQAMLALQERGCHNINLVTPTHYVPQIVRALGCAAELGLKIPVVYNCGGYESLEVLQLLDGIIDIYMPDVKFLEPDLSKRFCNAADYPAVVQEAVKEMQRQAGDLVTDRQGIALRGLIIRHLVMPSCLENTRKVIRFIHDEISKEAFVNIMAQYYPHYRACDFPEIARRITPEEYRSALQFAEDVGLRRAGGH